VSLAQPVIGDEEVEAVTKVLRSGWLSVGPETAAFERGFAEALGVGRAVAVSSGSAALHLALMALGIGPGHEVIVPSLTFVATANAVCLLGARPVFADVRSDQDLTIDPADVARLLRPSTRAIIAVHYGGWPADLKALRALADDAGVALVEDVAHAPVVQAGNAMLGTVGDAGCFSFFATKNLTMGEGGLVVARRPETLDTVRLLRSHAMTVNSWDREHGRDGAYDVVDVGFNYRPSEMAAALGRVQLGRLAADRRARAASVAQYVAGLASLPVAMAFDPEQVSAYHILPVLLPANIDRDEVQAGLREARIQSSVHYPPVHLFSAYRRRFGTGPGEVRRTEALSRRLLTLPLHANLSRADVALVCDSLARAIDRRLPAGRVGTATS